MESKAKWIKLWIQKHHDSLLKLSREDAGDIFQNIFRYASGEPLTEMSPVSEFVFEYIRQDIDSSIKLYEIRVDTAQENGKKGGRPPKPKEPEEKPKTEDVRHKYGEYQNVLLSDEELSKLKEELSERAVLQKIEKLSSYMKSTGKTYKSHYATLRNWLREDQKERGEAHEKISGDAEKGKTFNLEDFT